MGVSAEVILVSRTGRSLTEGAAHVTRESLQAFRPDDRTKGLARRALERHGFTVEDAGVSLTIEGEPETFERAFGLRLEVDREAAPGESIVSASGSLQLPEELEGLAETIVFPKRPHLFGQSTRKKRESHG